jgi:hypothetical protein
VAGELPWSYKDGRVSFLPESSATTLIANSAFAGTIGVNTPTNWSYFEDGGGTREIQSSTQIVGENRVKLTAGTGNRRAFLSQSITWENVEYRLQLTVEAYSGSGNCGFFVVNGRDVNFDLNQFSGFNPAGPFPQVITRTFTPTAGAGDLRLGFGVNDTDTLATDNDEITISGVDIKAQSFFSTPIIHSTSGSFTRNADVLEVTGAQDVIGQESGWIYAEVDWDGLYYSVRVLFSLSNTNNGIFLQIRATDSVLIGTKFLVFSTTTLGGNPTFFTGIDLQLGKNKIYCDYDFSGAQTVVNLYLNGVFVGQNSGLKTDGTPLNTIRITSITSTAQFNDPIFRTALGKGTLTEQQAIELTTI